MVLILEEPNDRRVFEKHDVDEMLRLMHLSPTLMTVTAAFVLQ